MLTGPSGFGKTTAAKMLARSWVLTFTKVDCSTLVEPNDIVHVAGFVMVRLCLTKQSSLRQLLLAIL